MTMDGNKMSGKTLIALLLFSAPLYMWEGFVLTKLWGWFLVPLGLPMISVAIAIGIILIHSFLVAAWNKDNNKNILDKMMFRFVAAAVSLLFGFIIQMFV